MNILNEALKVQEAALKEQERIEKKRIAQIKKERTAFEKFKITVEGLVDKLKEFDNLPISFYRYYENLGQYRYNDDTSTIDITYNGSHYNDRAYKTFQLYKGHKTDETRSCFVRMNYDMLSLDIEETKENGILIKFNRRALLFDEVKTLLLPYDKAWDRTKKTYTLQDVKTEFTDVNKAYEHIKGMMIKLANIEKLKELAEQTERKTILARHLGLKDIGTIENLSNSSYSNPNGIVLKTNGKEYRVLDKSEVPEWYAFMVTADAHKHADLGLLADATGFQYEELKTLHGLKPATFNTLIERFIKHNETYGKAMAKKYSFSKYIVAVENYFVVELGAI